MARSTDEEPGLQVVASNRRARRDYEILDTLECGMQLKGSEVKSLREAKVTLADTHARIIDGQLWILGLHISPYSHISTLEELEPERDRRLLAHRKEIDRFEAQVQQQRLTLVPLRLYFKNGKAKVELALARGKKQIDKRQDLAKREADRETQRALSRAAKGR